MRIEKVITIKGPRGRKPAEQKGPVRPSSIKRPLARRRPGGPFLKVFDIGQLANGSDSNLHEWIRSHSAPYEVFQVGATISLVSTVESNTLATRTADWNTDFLSIDIDDWPSTFKDVTADLYDYEVSVAGFDRYASNGLSSSTGVTVIEIEAVVGTDAQRDKWFFSFPTGGSGTRSVKYTATPSYAASSVSFTFDKNCDLFLVPVAFWGFGSSYTPLPYPIYNYEYYFVQRPLSRANLGDAGFENYWDNKASHGSIDATGRAFLRDYFINDPEGEIWRVRADDAGPTQPIDGDNPVFLPGSDFPEAGEGLGTPMIQVEGVGLFAGKLVGAIRKHLGGGTYEWYYMWASTFWQIPDAANLEDFEI